MKHKIPLKIKRCPLKHPPPPTISTYKGGNMGFNATLEISSCSADIKKLAKQDVYPVTNNF